MSAATTDGHAARHCVGTAHDLGVVPQNGEMRMKKTTMGLDYVHVKPGHTEFCDTIAQHHFYYERLFVALPIARHFDVLDFIVGMRSQLAGLQVPADMFSLVVNTDGVKMKGLHVEGDLIRPGTTVRLHVRNNSDEAHRFRAALYGRFGD